MDIKESITYKILYAPLNLAMKIALKFYEYPKNLPRWNLKLRRICIKFYDQIYVMEGVKGWRLSCMSNKEGTLTMADYS